MCLWYFGYIIKIAKNTINIAIVGIGNCASSLIQGLTYYENAQGSDYIPGLMHTTIAGYNISDIKVVAAFDVNKTKVGKDVADAIYAEPNNTAVFAKVKKTGVIVQNAELLDGIGEYLKDVVHVSSQPILDPVKILKETGADILVNYLGVKNLLMQICRLSVMTSKLKLGRQLSTVHLPIFFLIEECKLIERISSMSAAIPIFKICWNGEDSNQKRFQKHNLLLHKSPYMERLLQQKMFMSDRVIMCHG